MAEATNGRTLEEQISDLMRNLSRISARAARSIERLPALPTSHVDAIHELIVHGSRTPTQLSEALDLSRPTVSELIRKLEKDDFVVRRQSKTDRRSFVLVPTRHAHHVFDTFHVRRVEVVGEALDKLAPGDVDRIETAVPALNRMLDQLESIERQAKDKAAADAALGVG